MQPDPLAAVRDLCAEFERHARGEGDAGLAVFEAAFPEGFVFVAPNGLVVERATMLENLGASFGSRQLRIWVEAGQVLWESEGFVLVGYEEWHDHETYTTTRRCSALFEKDAAAPHDVRWRHVHETWVTPPPTSR